MRRRVAVTEEAALISYNLKEKKKAHPCLYGVKNALYYLGELIGFMRFGLGLLSVKCFFFLIFVSLSDKRKIKKIGMIKYFILLIDKFYIYFLKMFFIKRNLIPL